MLTLISIVSYGVLTLKMTSQALRPASASINGGVTDATTGEPLPGTNIFLIGASIGVIPTLDGEY